MAKKKYDPYEEWERIIINSETRIIACSIILVLTLLVYAFLFFSALIVDVFFYVSVATVIIALACVVVIVMGIHDRSMGKKQLEERENRIKRKKKRR